MSKRLLKNIPIVQTTDKIPQQHYLENLRPDEKVIVDDISYPHTRLGWHKLKDPNLKDKYQKAKSILSEKTWFAFMNSKEKSIVERINFGQIKPQIPSLFVIKRLPDKVYICRYDPALRYGGLVDPAKNTFYVFWVDQRHNDIYQHI